MQRSGAEAAEQEREKKPGQTPSEFCKDYGPARLLRNGPLIPGRWWVPTSIQERLRKAGRSVPRPVEGLLLLDTGASGTCISQSAARRIGLKETRLQKGYGAGGLHENPVYWARLELVFGEGSASPAIAWECEVSGIPDLEKYSERLEAEPGEAKMPLVGLLGRDVLRFADVHYNGVAGTLRIDFDLDLIDRIAKRLGGARVRGGRERGSPGRGSGG